MSCSSEADSETEAAIMKKKYPMYKEREREREYKREVQRKNEEGKEMGKRETKEKVVE